MRSFANQVALIKGMATKPGFIICSHFFHMDAVE